MCTTATATANSGAAGSASNGLLRSLPIIILGLSVGVLAGCDPGQSLGPSGEPEAIEILDVAPPTAEEIAEAEAMGLSLSDPELLFDQGPNTGRTGYCLGTDNGRNFADRFNLPEGGMVEQVSIFTCVRPKSGNAHLKLGDSPTGPFSYEQDTEIDSWTAVPGGYEVRITLLKPFRASAGKDFWVGIHGNNVRIGQFTLKAVDDGQMSQFSHGVFQSYLSMGDQMFRVYGSATLPDDTPPVITSAVAGTLGNDGWYTSDVTVTWTVSDEESEVTTSTGCQSVSITEDTEGRTFTCEATSEGGTSSESVTVRRDATRPVTEFSGNAGQYTVDQTVAISCSAADATSGLASSSCPEAMEEAYTFQIGENVLNASARDHAGHDTAASAIFEVQVTVASLCNLTTRWVDRAGVARALCRHLRQGLYSGYVRLLEAQVGKTVTADEAEILIRLVGKL